MFRGNWKREFSQRMDRLESAITSLAQGGTSQSALDKFATAAVESQANNLRAMGDFMATLSDVAAKRAAAAMGRRRSATAKRDKRGRMLPNEPKCRLCADGLVKDPSVAEIRAHATHGELKIERTPTALIAHVRDTDVQTGADGQQQIECPDCGLPASQHTNGHAH